MDQKKRFNRILKDIKSIKIQGATNIAKNALYAYSLMPNKESKRRLMTARPTEPMLFNAIKRMENQSYSHIISHFDSAQNRINEFVYKLIKNGDKIFTHCHSTNVIKALIYAKKKGKNFSVYNTETRPLMQGRKTSLELKKAGIKVTQFIDSSFAFAIERENKKDKIYADKIFLGSDAILKKGVINKIGSGLISEISYNHRIPIYIIADSWKFTNKKVPMEIRSLNEIWDAVPKEIKIVNPAFEFIPKKRITAIISEFGKLNYDKFLKKVGKEYYSN